MLGKVLLKIHHPRKKCVVHFDRLKPRAFVKEGRGMKNKKYCLLSVQVMVSRKMTLKLKLFLGKRRNHPVDHEVPVEPREVVVQEDIVALYRIMHEQYLESRSSYTTYTQTPIKTPPPHTACTYMSQSTTTSSFISSIIVWPSRYSPHSCFYYIVIFGFHPWCLPLYA